MSKSVYVAINQNGEITCVYEDLSVAGSKYYNDGTNLLETEFFGKEDLEYEKDLKEAEDVEDK